MKKILLTLVLATSLSFGGFFQEEDKKQHMIVSVPFGAIGGMICKKNYEGRGLALSGWKAVMCGTAIGMIPGIGKEWLDSQSGGSGWDNRDLGADLIGAFIGSLGTVTIWEFSSGNW